MPDNYPRVLVVNLFAFNQSNGAPITMSNLFKGWPRDKIAVVHRDINGNDPSYGDDFVVSHELALPGFKRGVSWETQLEKKHAKQSDDASEPNSYPRPSWLRATVRDVINALGIVPFMERFPLTGSLCEFVDNFRPDIIYTHLGNIPFARLVQDISEQYQLPVVVHMMDDYPATIYESGMLSFLARHYLQKQHKKIFSQAALCMSICQAMTDEYRERYRRDFISFHNPADLSVWSQYISDLSIKGKQVKIVYSGRVGMAMISSIQDVCDVVRTWTDPELSPVFDIFVNDLDEALQSAPFLNDQIAVIKVKQAPADLAAIAKILSEADILLLPIDFDSDSIEYIRFSMPTKVPAYMATGKPILVYGPPEVAPVKYALADGWGYVVSEQSQALLREGIKRLSLDKQLRIKLSQQAKTIVAEKHDAHRVRKEFKDAIAQAVQHN